MHDPAVSTISAWFEPWGEEDAAPAALLAAAVVRARLDAARGDQEALAWLAEFVETPARELLARREHL